MDLNQHMHPRNIYKANPPDFTHLAQKYPEFGKYVKRKRNGNPYVDFRNPPVLRALTKCLLHKDFGLVVNPPPDRLTPTVPLRLNYLLWIEDLLHATEFASDMKYVIDIGTGSLCIYPLLGVKMNTDWKFIATEVDSTNHTNAVETVVSNNLEGCIDVIKVESSDKMLADILEKSKFAPCRKVAACMCNPPFFSHADESSFKVGPAANSSCSGDSVEIMAEGGDLAFASKLYEESLQMREKIFWYTIMLGKKSSFASLKKRLTENNDILFVSYEFCQGRTMRWGVAWTFCASKVEKAKLPVCSLKTGANSEKLAKPITFIARNCESVPAALQMLQNAFDSLQITSKVLFHGERKVRLKCSAESCTWVHVRKRARKRKFEETTSLAEFNGFADPTGSDVTDDVKLLECDVTITLGTSDEPLLQFKTELPSQKETLNSLVVYLKRSIFTVA